MPGLRIWTGSLGRNNSTFNIHLLNRSKEQLLHFCQQGQVGNEGTAIPDVIQKSSCDLWNTHKRVVFLFKWQKKTVEICSAGWWGRAYWENFEPFNTGCRNMIICRTNRVKTKNELWNQKINLVFLGGAVQSCSHQLDLMVTEWGVRGTDV